MRQYIEQHFRIRVGVNVPAVILEHLNLELLPISEIAVVTEDDAERRVHIKRLCLLLAGGPGGRITALADTGIAQQRTHVSRTEHVAHQAVRLMHCERMSIAGCDARRILSSMLQQQQRIVDLLIDGTMGNYADYATHGGLLNKT